MNTASGVGTEGQQEIWSIKPPKESGWYLYETSEGRIEPFYFTHLGEIYLCGSGESWTVARFVAHRCRFGPAMFAAPKPGAAIPSKESNPNGLHRRYVVAKADGTIDPNATYFVLRLDGNGDDKEHIAACRTAARAYLDAVINNPRLVRIGAELRNLVDSFERGEEFDNSSC